MYFLFCSINGVPCTSWPYSLPYCSVQFSSALLSLTWNLCCSRRQLGKNNIQWHQTMLTTLLSIRALTHWTDWSAFRVQHQLSTLVALGTNRNLYLLLFTLCNLYLCPGERNKLISEWVVVDRIDHAFRKTCHRSLSEVAAAYQLSCWLL